MKGCGPTRSPIDGRVGGPLATFYNCAQTDLVCMYASIPSRPNS